MKQIGIHVLTAYPPSNPNRDENGQPKTAIVGGVKRQRISSQCIKRTWRLSEAMQSLEAGFSIRTRGIGMLAEEAMVAGGMEAKAARKRAVKIAEQFGKVDKKNEPNQSEMVVIGFEERDAALELARKLAEDDRDPNEAELAGLQKDTVSVDVALFGRMRAASPVFSKDASVYVSHPLTTGKALIDADFWTSVDDLKLQDDEADGGAGGMGDVEFGSGCFYTYVQLNAEALTKNLGGNEDLARQAIAKLIEAIATTTPNGHKTTFGNAVRASYLRVEIGQPSGNLFCKAFESPVTLTPEATTKLRDAADAEAAAYGLEQHVFEFTAKDPSTTLGAVITDVTKALEAE